MANFIGFVQYARLMPDDNDVTAALCFQEACTHAADLGIPRKIIDSGTDAKLDTYIYFTALYFYENRGYSLYARSKSTEDATQSIMNKMRIELQYKYRRKRRK